MSESYSGFTIRKMDLSDVNSVIKIAEICELASWSEESYRQELQLENSASLVVIVNHKIAGFAIARIIIETLEILNIAVLPEFRRQKIGKQLLDSILNLGKSKGIAECWLEVREKNTAALNFYLANKFIKTGKRLNYYSQPSDNAILMSLKLVESNPKK